MDDTNAWTDIGWQALIVVKRLQDGTNSCGAGPARNAKDRDHAKCGRIRAGDIARPRLQPVALVKPPAAAGTFKAPCRAFIQRLAT